MELELVYNEETQEWEQKPEPFITIECETEEDFEFIGTAVAFYKKHLEEQEKPQTNAERIRAMSDEELEKIIAIIARFDTCINPGRDCEECPLLSLCENCLPMHELEWLQQPAEEG